VHQNPQPLGPVHLRSPWRRSPPETAFGFPSGWAPVGRPDVMAEAGPQPPALSVWGGFATMRSRNAELVTGRPASQTQDRSRCERTVRERELSRPHCLTSAGRLPRPQRAGRRASLDRARIYPFCRRLVPVLYGKGAGAHVLGRLCAARTLCGPCFARRLRKVPPRTILKIGPSRPRQPMATTGTIGSGPARRASLPLPVLSHYSIRSQTAVFR
jgi:hypothetical protein